MALKKLQRGSTGQPKVKEEKAAPALPSILYVEDNDANWDIAKLLLKGSYQLKRASCARGVVERLSEEPYDVILMDIELQGSELDGVQLTKLLRGQLEDVPDFAKELGPSATPILFMTAYMARYPEADLLEYGADGVVYKPVDPEGLNSSIWRMLSRQRLISTSTDARQRETEMMLQSAEAQRQASEAKVRGAQAELERESKLRGQIIRFLHNVSHELTTPLTLILNPLQELLEDQPDNPLLSMAHSNSRKLLSLVYELLEFQKFEFEKKNLTLRAVDMTWFMESSGNYFQMACENKNIDFKMSFNGEPLNMELEPVPILAELGALEKVTTSLLSRALRLTPRGGAIELGLETAENSVRFFVRDGGDKLIDEERRNAFDFFSGTDSSSEGLGAGIALAIVKTLAEEMVGTVGVEVDTQAGNIFWMDFPRIHEEKPLADVLIVDDDQDIRVLLEHHLSNTEGIANILLAENVVEALDLLSKTRVRCLITDYEMDGRDGMDFLEEVAGLYPEIKRVLLTGHADTDLMRRAINEVHVDQVFYKPIVSDEIVKAIVGLIASSTLVDTQLGSASLEYKGDFQYSLSAEHEDEPEESDENVVLQDEIVLVIAEQPDLRLLISNVLKRHGYGVMTADCGVDGLEMANQLSPALVLTDWAVGSMSGPELISSFKSDPEMGFIPAVLLTSKSDGESWRAGLESGADAFLGKPFSRLELASTVESLLRLKKTENSAREQSRYLEAIFESMRDGVLVLSEQCHVQEVNPSMAEMLGRPLAELAGTHFFDLLESYDFVRLAGVESVVKNDEPVTVVFSCGDQESIALSVSGVELRNLDGRRSGYLLTARDQRRAQEMMLQESRQLAELAETRDEIERRTEGLQKAYEDLQQQQDQMVQTEKLASLGAMVAGVAHEINTPIGVSLTAATHILPQARELEEQLNNNALSKKSLVSFVRDSAEGLGIINSNLNRASELIRSFKQVAVDQTVLETRKILVHGYLEELIRSLGPELKRHNHSVVLEEVSRDIELNLDPGSFAQVITNLILNAMLHAFEEGQAEGGHVDLRMKIKPTVVIVEIQDDGRGIPEENRTKIFDPFFTTRKGTGGTGLGLHIVHNIVTNQLGGTIDCESEVGRGTTFTISIPY